MPAPSSPSALRFAFVIRHAPLWILVGCLTACASKGDAPKASLSGGVGQTQHPPLEVKDENKGKASLSLEENTKRDTLIRAGESLFARSDYRTSRESLESALAIDPTHPRGNALLAHALLMLGAAERPDKAAPLYQSGLESLAKRDLSRAGAMDKALAEKLEYLFRHELELLGERGLLVE